MPCERSRGWNVIEKCTKKVERQLHMAEVVKDFSAELIVRSYRNSFMSPWDFSCRDPSKLKLNQNRFVFALFPTSKLKLKSNFRISENQN